MTANRRYTGFDGDVSGKRAGLEKFVELTVNKFNGGVWNNGTWGSRPARNPNAPPKPSVHGTGRAADMSWRTKPEQPRGYGSHDSALQVVEFWEAHAELFLIEAIHDYFPSPWGRGWSCDRSSWKVYQKPTIGLAPNGDWFHVEIASAHADDPGYYEKAFASADGAPLTVVTPGPAQTSPASDVAGSGLVAPVGDPELSEVGGDVVRQVVMDLQKILIANGWASFTKADGKYGPNTSSAVKKMQAVFGFSVTSQDGKYGPGTAKKLAEVLAARK